jgi:hypothetical protein
VALANLDMGYLAWKRALGNITKSEFFVRMEALPETGQAVKKLIHHLRDGGAIP